MIKLKDNFERYLAEALENRASDIHLSVGSRPTMRVDGELKRFGNGELESGETEGMAQAIMNLKQQAIFDDYGEVDMAYTISDGTRFRINVYRQMETISIAARVIPNKIPSIEDLGLPKILNKIARNDKGLVLVTGPTGSGKSSTLAAMIDYINHHTNKHIVTLEDPIEFIHQNKQCLIEQRQIGLDTLTFDTGLRAALRQDPDVILVGELRDNETIKAALTAAETGHLVFGTLHTQTASSTIDRIIDSFTGEVQPQIRNQIANSLKAVISQRLVKRVDGGRIAATEILINNNAISNLIRSEKIHQIRTVLQMGSGDGMRTLEKSIKMLLEEGTISEDVLFDLNITLDL